MTLQQPRPRLESTFTSDNDAICQPITNEIYLDGDYYLPLVYWNFGVLSGWGVKTCAEGIKEILTDKEGCSNGIKAKVFVSVDSGSHEEGLKDAEYIREYRSTHGVDIAVDEIPHPLEAMVNDPLPECHFAGSSSFSHEAGTVSQVHVLTKPVFPNYTGNKNEWWRTFHIYNFTLSKDGCLSSLGQSSAMGSDDTAGVAHATILLCHAPSNEKGSCRDAFNPYTRQWQVYGRKATHETKKDTVFAVLDCLEHIRLSLHPNVCAVGDFNLQHTEMHTIWASWKETRQSAFTPGCSANLDTDFVIFFREGRDIVSHQGQERHKKLGDKAHYPIAAKMPIWFPVTDNKMPEYREMQRLQCGPSPATQAQPVAQPQATQGQPVAVSVEPMAAALANQGRGSSSYPEFCGAPLPGTTPK